MCSSDLVSPSSATGRIAFSDGTTGIGSCSLSTGTCAISTSALALGTHPITAVYEPTGSYGASSSSALSQIVQLVATTTSLTSSAANTVAAYRRDVEQFAAWAEDAGVDDPVDVDRTLLRRYVGWLTSQGRAKRSIARAVSSLRRYFAHLRREGVVEVDPSMSLRAPKGDGRLPRVLDHEAVDVLLDGPTPEDEPHWRRVRDDAVLEVLYASGVRVGELCGLDLDSLDLSAGAMSVWGKGSKQRRVPLGEPADRKSTRLNSSHT